ncbi:MAG: HAD-IA family hydrolase [Candidatus Sumerlaeales bacterium]|nr:HAD-IA family hydrolase [Candidatus Sumerlaeales bacterium]
MTTKETYTAILFDAGGTLLGTNVDSPNWYEQFFADIARNLGYNDLSIDDISRVLKQTGKNHPATDDFWCHDDMINCFWEYTYNEVFAKICSNHDSHVLTLEYINRFKDGEFTQLFSDTIPALQMIKSKSIPIGLVSNFGSYLSGILDRLNIASYFDFTLISAQCGCAKPQHDIFRLAHEKLGDVEPNRVLFVGDLLKEDYDGSKDYGFTPVLIDRNHNCVNDDVRRIDTLMGLEQYLV